MKHSQLWGPWLGSRGSLGAPHGRLSGVRSAGDAGADSGRGDPQSEAVRAAPFPPLCCRVRTPWLVSQRPCRATSRGAERMATCKPAAQTSCRDPEPTTALGRHRLSPCARSSAEVGCGVWAGGLIDGDAGRRGPLLHSAGTRKGPVTS